MDMDGIECCAPPKAATRETGNGVLDRAAWTSRVMRRGEAFRRRVKEAEGDAARLADLLAEAVDMAYGRRGTSELEAAEAAWCLQTVRVAYQAARMRDAEKPE